MLCMDFHKGKKIENHRRNVKTHTLESTHSHVHSLMPPCPPKAFHTMAVLAPASHLGQTSH